MSARCSSRDDVVAVLGCHGDACAGGDGQGEAVHLDRTLHLRVELVDDLDRTLGIGDVGDDQGELVAAEPGHGGPAGHGPQQALGDLAQEAVADGVAQRVVDVLEAVDVEQHDRHPAALAHGGGGAGEEQHPVGQTRQHVVGGLVGLAVDFVTQLLDEPGSLEAGAGVGDQRLEQPEVVFVEAVQFLVAIDGHDGADGGVPVHQGRDDRVAVLADDRDRCHGSVLGDGRVE